MPLKRGLWQIGVVLVGVLTFVGYGLVAFGHSGRKPPPQFAPRGLVLSTFVASAAGGSTSVAQAPNGDVLVAGDGFVERLDPRTRRVLKRYSILGRVNGIASDAAGGILIAGTGSLRISHTRSGAGSDGFVARISSQDRLVYVHYFTPLGGSTPYALSASPTGNAYVVGSTTTDRFPLIHPAVSAPHARGGFAHVFIAEVDRMGRPVFSTVLAGSRSDEGRGVALDSFGAVYATGFTTSADWPITHSVERFQGPVDMFAAKLSPDGRHLIYNSLLGSETYGMGIAANTSGNAYLIGHDQSARFPMVHAFDSNAHQADKAVIVELNPAGDRIVFSTYLGGSGSDEGHAIAIDPQGRLWMTGRTTSTDFPTVHSGVTLYGGNTCSDAELVHPCHDAWIAEMSGDGKQLLYSAYLTGDHDDEGYAVSARLPGHVWVTGLTCSDDFPTLHALQASNNGRFNDACGGAANGFLAEIQAGG